MTDQVGDKTIDDMRQDADWLIRLRTILFYALSFVCALPFLLLWPMILLPRSVAAAVCDAYLHLQSVLLKHVCGISYRVVGRENLPNDVVLIASQHESTWETLYFQLLLDRPVMYAKKEIFSYPVFGPLTRKLGHIPVDRSGGPDAVREGFRKGVESLQSGRNLLIFPSGTRRMGASIAIQSGVGVLYQLANVSVVPVKVNSGHCWPHGTWLKYPGSITVEILPAIAPGMSRPEFMQKLREDLDGGAASGSGTDA